MSRYVLETPASLRASSANGMASQSEVRQLRSEVLELRQEDGELRREYSELRQKAEYWKAPHALTVSQAEHLEGEVENLRGENRRLQDWLFGVKRGSLTGECR
jgi:chromosome segregation ATPase